MIRPTWWLYRRAGLDPHEIDLHMTVGERLDEMSATGARMEKKLNTLVLESQANTRLIRVTLGVLVVLVLVVVLAIVKATA